MEPFWLARFEPRSHYPDGWNAMRLLASLQKYRLFPIDKRHEPFGPERPGHASPYLTGMSCDARKEGIGGVEEISQNVD
jgi:hypothetical protein